MRSLIRTIFLAATFATVATLLHGWQPPYGLFVALIVVVAMMRYISRSSYSRAPLLLAAAIWFTIVWIASTERNGGEFLIQGDSIGSSFLVGGSALVVLLTITSLRRRS